MPFKCSVKGCRSNYDSTNEKVSVFQFPADDKLKKEWLNNIELNSKLTNSSRICIKHFKPGDIEVSIRRSIPKPYAVPLKRLHHHSEWNYVETCEINRNLINSFEEFSEGLDEMSEIICENWNIYTHPEGICFYHLSNDQNFNDVNMSFKILINNNMRVKMFNNGTEASEEELKWVLTDSHLLYWAQLEKILGKYQNEPEVIRKNQPTKCLHNALEALDLVRREELQEQIDSIKTQIISLHELSMVLPSLDYEELDIESEYLSTDAVKDNQNLDESYEEVVESIEEFWENEDKSNEDKDLEDLEEDINAQKSKFYEEPITEVSQAEANEHEDVATNLSSDEIEQIIEYEDPFKCPNCFIKLMSETGFQSHIKTCKVVTNLKLPLRKSKLPDFVQPTKPEMNICDSCGKSFRTIKGLKLHIKLHIEENRVKCPHCDIELFSGCLKRHIKAVHYKEKPHKW